MVERHGQTLADFQMASMGPLLLRPRGQPDNRVRRFNPDTWQKRTRPVLTLGNHTPFSHALLPERLRVAVGMRPFRIHEPWCGRVLTCLCGAPCRAAGCRRHDRELATQVQGTHEENQRTHHARYCTANTTRARAIVTTRVCVWVY